MKTTLQILLMVSVLLCFNDVNGQLNQHRPEVLEQIGVDEKLGDTIPLDIEFVTSDGVTVMLGDLIEEGKPVLLNPLYYECPVLCNLVVESVFKVVDELIWSPGEDYTIISFSIDPEEDYKIAKTNKDLYVDKLNKPNAGKGWHFLTSDQESIKALTDAIGFRYTYDERTGEYLHLASIMMLSPEGVVTRYLYGASFREFDLRNALYEAADGTIGSTLDQILLYCFTYDPSSQSYVPVAMNIMKLGGLATLIFLGIFLGVFWRREKNKDSIQTTKFELDK